RPESGGTPPSVLEALAKPAQRPRVALGRLGVEEPNHRLRRLLRARRERPRGCGAAEQGDELAALLACVLCAAERAGNALLWSTQAARCRRRHLALRSSALRSSPHIARLPLTPKENGCMIPHEKRRSW